MAASATGKEYLVFTPSGSTPPDNPRDGAPYTDHQTALGTPDQRMATLGNVDKLMASVEMGLIDDPVV